MSGEATPTQIGGFLMALRVRGETVDEIAGAVAAMRAKMTKVDGAGGRDRHRRHGRRRVRHLQHLDLLGLRRRRRRRAGRQARQPRALLEIRRGRRADELGVKIDLTPEKISECIREAGIGFMFAPNHHAAMRHVGPSRAELGTRTVFNLLGPLCNPASVKRYMLGVFAREWVEPIANVLASLGAEAAWVVHGSFGERAGLDELSLTGTSYVAELKEGHVRPFQVEPIEFGVDPVEPEALLGGTPEENAKALRDVLEGELGAFRDVVIMNAGAGFMAAGKAALLSDAAELAREVDRFRRGAEGARQARRRLERLS